MLMLEPLVSEERFRRGSKWRGKNDFYPTPVGATRALAELRILPRLIYEPACGDGALADVLDEHMYHVFMTDLVDRGAGLGGVDFFDGWLPDIMKSGTCWAIVTNPPYSLANQFVQRALDHDPDMVVMLLPLKFLEGATRYHTLHRHQPPAEVYVFMDRVTFYAGDYDGDQPGWNTEAFAWFVWRRGVVQPPQVHWISRGPK